MVPVVVTTTADTAQLSPEDAEKLQAMVDDSGLFELSPSGDPSPDAASYEFIVEDERRSCRLVLNDGEMPAAVRELLAWIRTVPGHEEQVGPL
jgi:hypothetical protein